MRGKFSALFEKVAKLQKKNDFALAIIVGDFFALPEEQTSDTAKDLSRLLNGSIEIPLTTYFTLSGGPFPSEIIDRLESSKGELCPNLFFVGKRSVTKTSEEIRIVALGGNLDPEASAGVSKDKYLPFHTESDAKLLYGANSADLVITSNWPASIRTRSKVQIPDGVEEPEGEQCISDLCETIKPRYHFSSSPLFFYEREPFFHPSRNDQPDVRPITRFISLAAFDNDSKQKWLYAFSLSPNTAPNSTIPTGATASPLAPSKKRQRLEEQQHVYARFSGQDRHPHSAKRKRALKSPGECFFCLSNPDLATHLISSIANDAYLTTAKGPLSTSNTYSDLGFPAHILIIPLTHSATFGSIADIDERFTTYKEMQRYRDALHRMVSERSKQKLGSVTWEVSRASGIHLHWQFLPIDSGIIEKGLVDAAFKVEAENEKYPMFKAKANGDGVGELGDYFRVVIQKPSPGDGGADRDQTSGEAEDRVKGKSIEKSLVLPLSEDFRFNLNFGRVVMAKLLALEDRVSWRDCAQTVEQESADVEAFKNAFKSFDFALDD